ncbi:MAG TPA: DUF6785 family protein [Tepidisphaeraceae bacterium]|jgi:hypothetical protein|nr:DUF6785 family protein [Tepidisphaeraceae bacterium]
MAPLPLDPSATEPPRRGAITWRSLLLGTIGVAAICTITPYNDYVINNSFFTGSYIPPALVLALVLVVVANGLLHRWWPRVALSRGEMGVITAMLLVSCAVPGQGLMRNLVPLPVAFFNLGRGNDQIWQAFINLGLPEWLFPVADVESGRGNEVVLDFYSRTPEGGSIPWSAWVVPLLGWGAFAACMFTALIALATLLRQQWAVNERLPFPLAQVGIMLIEPPAAGRAFNRLMSNKSFWIATASVFVLQGMGAMYRYQPTYFPDLSFTYDLTKTLSEEPWRHLMHEVKRSTLYFTFVGITYFIQSRVGFSLWAIFLIEQVILMSVRSTGADMPNAVWDDQHLGACVVFLLATIWIGRRHWATVVRQAVGLRTAAVPGEPSYATRARVLLLAIAGMIAWLLMIGVSPAFAVALVGLILAAHIIVARIVAETGLPFIRVMVTSAQVTSNFAPSLLTNRDVFAGGLSSYFGPIASRESVLPHALHGLQIAAGDDTTPRQRRGVIAAMVWALLVAFSVSAVASLWCYYTYALPLSVNANVMENHWGAVELPRQYIANGLVDHAREAYPPKSHNVPLHVGTGAVVTGVLQWGALRFAGWPFMPVAYLVSHTWYVRLAWWSILLGWTAKVLILRFGGAGLYQTMKPVFVGLIVGEALAAGFWLLVALVLVWTGYGYQVVQFLPQ